MSRPTLYIAGPMRHRAGFNFPSFYRAEQVLDGLGYDAVNPARHDVEVLGFEYERRTGFEDLAELGFDLPASLGHDLDAICRRVDGVLVLSGWHTSSGATAEVAVAEALGKPVYRLGRNVANEYRLVRLDVTVTARVDREVVSDAR